MPRSPPWRTRRRTRRGRTPKGVGVGERRAARRGIDAEMAQLPARRRQPEADLAQRRRVRQLREQHRHELEPGAEAFGGLLHRMLARQRVELAPVD